MQPAQTTPEYPQNYGYSTSSRSAPRFHVPEYYTKRQWGMHRYIEPQEQNIDQELVQQAVARWKEGARRAMNIRSQQELHTSPSQLVSNQAIGQRN